MICVTIAGPQRWVFAMLICAVWAQFCAAAQGSATGSGIANKLERAGVIDAYFPEIAFDVASGLAQAVPGQWRGVLVNSAHRAGWLNIYLIDAQRLPEDGLLADEGIESLTPGNLHAGALTDEDTGTIFLNTAMWKRLTAATVMTQTKVQPDLTAALASVDAIGLDGVRKFWDPAALSVDTPANQRTGWLVRGALAFVLAHEMGHMRIGGHAQSEEPDKLRMNLTPRQQDERRACPELVDKESRQRKKQEQAADLAGAAMLGQQCRIGVDGELRHSIYMLGTTWYFLASMSDKLIDMGRNTNSPVIAQALRVKIGPELYQQVVAAHAREKRGAVASAFPYSHPPDTARMQSIEAALHATPCGSNGLDTSGAQVLEMYRLQMCRQLIGRGPAR